MEYPFKDLMPLDEVLAREGYYKDWTHLDPEVFYSLTQISEYIKTKGYGSDVRLLIAQLAEHFGLKADDIDKAHQQFTDVMLELSKNQDYHSLPEIAAARGGRITLGQRLTESDVKLNQVKSLADSKMDKNTTNISVNQINKNLGKLDQTFMSDEFLQQMAGSTPINAVPADKSITTNKLSPSLLSDIDSKASKESLMKVNEKLFELDTVENGILYRNTSTRSTFSGWGSTIGRQSNFRKMSFFLYAFNADIMPTSLRSIIKIDDHEGKIVADVIRDINLKLNAWTEIEIEFDETIENADRNTLWFEFYTDGKVATKTINPIPGVPLKMMYATNDSLDDLSMADTYSPAVEHTYVKLKVMGENLNAHFASEVSSKAGLPREFVDSKIFKNTFGLKVSNNFRVESEAGVRAYLSSSFSGWGSFLKPTPSIIENFRFKFRNRGVPVTSVLLHILSGGKDGKVLATQEISVTGEPFQDVVVDWNLNTPVLNDGLEPLYFAFQANQFLDLYRVPGEGAGTSYRVDGVQDNPASMPYASTQDSFIEFKEYSSDSAIYEPGDLFKESLGSISHKDQVRVILPDEISAVVGDTLQLFYRGIVEAVDPYQYDIRVTCAKGRQFTRYFEFTPLATDVGTHDFYIEVRDNLGNLLASDTTKLKVVNIASPSSPKNILSIGDSLTSGGLWVKEARRRLMTSGGTPAGNGLNNFNFIGTKTDGPTGWEGVGGWTWNNYLAQPSPTTSDIVLYVNSHDKTANDQKSLWKDSAGNTWELETIEPTRLKFNRVAGNTSVPPTGAGAFTHQANATHTSNITYTDLQFADSNPFWDADLGRVSFKSYCTRNGFSGIDYLYTLLTWNGGRADKYDSSHNQTEINQAKQLIDILHSEYPNAQVRMMGIQLPSLNGGTGTNYGAVGNYSHAYALVRGVFGLNLAYQEFANRDGYKDFVKFVNVSSQFDSENLMPEMDKPVNTRSSKTEKLGTNGVHPTAEGYLAIGDIAYRSILGDV